VALFLPALHGGGAERITLNLAQGLEARWADVDLVLATDAGEYRGAVPAKVRTVDLRARRTATSVVALARYLHEVRPAALLSALNHANVVAVAAAHVAGFRRPVLVAEHNEVYPFEPLTLPRRAWLATLRAAYHRATRVIVVSEGVKRSLEKKAGVRADHVEVIYNPVITPELERAADAERPDHPFLRDRCAPVVLGVGRLTRQKNFANLLRAFALLRARRDARLIVLGEGEERARLEALADELGIRADVSLPGFVSNPYAFLRAASVFASSSDWEGLPTVLIEALAVGTPVVATDCPSGPDEILGHGAHGTLVPPRDSAALADAIDVVLSRDATAEIDPGWLQRFTVDHATRAYAKALGLRGAERPT
jgi:glycosyltransferase involved in cell wall biosynthesis